MRLGHENSRLLVTAATARGQADVHLLIKDDHHCLNALSTATEQYHQRNKHLRGGGGLLCRSATSRGRLDWGFSVKMRTRRQERRRWLGKEGRRSS
eukprot:UN14518